MNSRLRESDTFGWYDAGDIAAILPYASHANAFLIGQAICQMVDIPKVGSFTVYSYPDHWVNDPELCLASAMTTGKTALATDLTATASGSAGATVVGGPRAGAGERRGEPGAACLSEVDDFIAKPMPAWKRAMDIVGALLGLCLCSPLFLLAAVGIMATSPGPIFFRQTRIGYKRRPFTLLKFRSMAPNCAAEKHRKFMKHLISQETDRPHTKLTDDERIFPFGLFLRKTSIDELPQLINVLRGEMSLVGPRPCLDYEAEEYLLWHSRRFYSMPGLTGLWQVSGKNRLSFQQMIRLDIQYIKRLSFWGDVKILLKTLPAVLSILLEKGP